MNSKILLLTLLISSGQSFAKTSDLLSDSAKNKGFLGTPFQEKIDDQELSLKTANTLRRIVFKCVVNVIETKEGEIKTDFGFDLLPACKNILTLDYDKNTVSYTSTVNLGSTVIFAKTFDGKNSDGGDEFDVAIYNIAGKRIAVKTAIYDGGADGKSLEGLAILAGISLSAVHKIEKSQFDKFKL